ncbi:MAG: carbohydrate ABC transporter permease [Spirochaetota bacterium]
MTSLFRYKYVKYVSLGLLLLLISFSLLPSLWMFITSFKGSAETYTSPPTWVPTHPTLDNFGYILRRGKFAIYFRNSVIVALATTIVTLIVSSSAGYAFSRFRFPGRGFLLLAFLITQMFPSVLLIIPLFQIVKAARLINTLYALVLSYVTFTLPLYLADERVFRSDPSRAG